MSEEKWFKKAKEICEKYYDSKCDVCPLRPSCVHGPKEYKKWMQNLKEEVEKI